MRAIVIHYGIVGTMKIHYCIQLLNTAMKPPPLYFPPVPAKIKEMINSSEYIYKVAHF